MRSDAYGSLLLRSSLRSGKASTSANPIASRYRHYATSDFSEPGESSTTQGTQQSIESLDGLFGKTSLNSSLTETHQINRQPDLAALDQLSPPRRNAGTDSHVNVDLWKKTLKRVMHSFNFHQLEKLCSEADVPRSLLARYKVKSIQRATKEIRAKVLLLHRFHMTDPALRAQDQALQKARASQMQNLEVPISQIALLLLALSGQAELQRLLQAQRVKLLPVKVDKDDSLLMVIQGSKQGTINVQMWLISFLERIQSVTQPLSSYSISESIHPPDDHRLRLMSQISQTIVSLDKTAQNVTIHSVNEAALATAETMLSQYLHDTQMTQQRQYHSYASSSDRQLNEEVPFSDGKVTYAFVPHVGPSPLPWQSDPGTQGSLFRIAQQNEFSPSESVFAKQKKGTAHQTMLQRVDAKESLSDRDLFSTLKSKISKSEAPPGTWSYSAEFGHLLFDNHNRASSSRVLSLVYPPLKGSWPLENGLEWLQQIVNDKSGVSKPPSFCSDIPPLAFSLDAGFISPAAFNAASSRSTSDPDSDVNRSNEKWSEELLRMGFPLGLGRSKNELTNIVNLSTPHFTETVVITYAGKDADLIFEVEDIGVKNASTSTDVTYLTGVMAKRAIADVLVPEASVDLRLSAINTESLARKDLIEDKGLHMYFEGNTNNVAAEIDESSTPIDADFSENVSAESDKKQRASEKETAQQSAILPRRVTVKGQEFIFISAKKTNRWEWPLQTEPAKHYNGKIILERAANDLKGNYVSSFKIHFNEREGVITEPGEQGKIDKTDEELSSGMIQETQSKSTVDNGEEAVMRAAEEDRSADIGSIPITPVWNSMRTYIDLFLARGYRSIRGR